MFTEIIDRRRCSLDKILVLMRFPLSHAALGSILNFCQGAASRPLHCIGYKNVVRPLLFSCMAACLQGYLISWNERPCNDQCLDASQHQWDNMYCT